MADKPEQTEAKGPLGEPKNVPPLDVHTISSYAFTSDDVVEPGLNTEGLILDHTQYINPKPELDYKFCTLDGRRSGRNRTAGWRPVRTEGGRLLAPIGNMQLCCRPKEIGEKRRKFKTQRAFEHYKRHSAHEAAQRHDLANPTEKVVRE